MQKQKLEEQNDFIQLEDLQTQLKQQRNFIIRGGLTLGLIDLFGMQLFRMRKERNDMKTFVEALLYAQEEERKTNC